MLWLAAVNLSYHTLAAPKIIHDHLFTEFMQNDSALAYIICNGHRSSVLNQFSINHLTPVCQQWCLSTPILAIHLLELGLKPNSLHICHQTGKGSNYLARFQILKWKGSSILLPIPLDSHYLIKGMLFNK